MPACLIRPDTPKGDRAAVLLLAMKLGTLLLRDGAIGLPQLEAGLRNQVLYGGKLGTNLIELGFIDLDLLGRYLGDVCGHPVASPQLLDAAPRELLDLVGADLAHALGAIAFARMADDGGIAVGMIDPSDDLAVETLSSHFDAPVTTYVVPELRALYLLEKHYGRPRLARFVRPGIRRVQPVSRERRKTQPPGGMEMPGNFTVEPRARRSSRAISLPPIVAPRAITMTFDEAVDRIDQARDREQIADAIITFTDGRVGAAAIFLVRDGNALGWRGHGTEGGASITSLSFPLAGASILQAGHDVGSTFRGTAQTPGLIIEHKLWAWLGSATPEDLVVVPVMVHRRAVNLIYAHGDDDAVGSDGKRGRLDDAVVAQLELLAEHAQAAYLRLIERMRRE